MTQLSDELFNASLSAMYHRRRAAFLIAVTRVLGLLTILLGTGSFAALTASHSDLAQLGAIAVAVIGAVVIVYAPETAAANHRRWYEAWHSLEREIRLTPQPSHDQLVRWAEIKARVECEYPDELRALAHDCYNRVAGLYGRVDNIYSLPWYARWFIQVHSFEQVCRNASKRYQDAVLAAG